LFVLAACTQAARADGYGSPGGSTYLELGRYDTSFKYSDGDHAAVVGRYGVAFSQPIADDFDFELHGGYLTLDVDGEPSALQMNSSGGRYLGLMGRYEDSQGDYLNFSAEAAYTWYDVNSSGYQATPSESVWYESWGAAGPVFRYDRWRLSLGVYYQNFSGTETDANPHRVLDFSASRGAGAYAGISFYIDPTGSIGLYATTGARHGVNLVFRREF
jgi:hypothetical protein